MIQNNEDGLVNARHAMAIIVDDTTKKTGLCDCLIHPFQQDPGMSQPRRVMEELLSGKAKIDARKMADLLDYFNQLSRQINYYDSDLKVSDWQPFFENSLPFVLASLIKYNTAAIKENYTLYCSLFEKKPSASGLQLIQFFIFYRVIKPLNNWYQKLKGSELPVERVFENIVRDKIRQPLLDFISLNRLASKWFSIPPINFTGFFTNDTWSLPSSSSLTALTLTTEEKITAEATCERLTVIYNKTIPLFGSLFESISLLSKIAEQSMEQSFFPLKEEFQKKHLPQLGLLFAFLKLFQQLQADLNGYTKKHLDFFYKEVLKIKSKEAVPDKVNIVFAIQKELNDYLLEKGLLLKDGKDVNKEEILFSLNDEIVVNQAQVKDTRTLFLNNQVIPDPDGTGNNIALLEGVYMAPDATKADGMEEDFQTDVKNFYTLGNKESKYLFPGAGIYKPYPNARLGFVLASPVLLLNEGMRTVTITLDCKLDEEICSELAGMSYPPSTRCCGNLPVPVNGDATPSPVYPDFLLLNKLYDKVVQALSTPYYYISEEIIKDLIKKGVGSALIKKLRDRFLVSTNKSDNPEKAYCYCPVETRKYDAIISQDEWASLHSGNNSDDDVSGTELQILDELIPSRLPLKLSFSGEKAWIETNKDNPVTFSMKPGAYATSFILEMEAVLTPELDPVTFYDKEALTEDLGTTMPLVKIELDDKLKILLPYSPDGGGCCLDKELEFEHDEIPVSLYHFFRHVKVGPVTDIHVDVCGVKKLIVQNDESVMDANGPIYPFGSRPDIIDFNVVNRSTSFCITPAFINEASISAAAKTALMDLLTPANNQKVKVPKATIDKFLDQQFLPSGYYLTGGEKSTIKLIFADQTKNYCNDNYTGPSFYIGSKEVFCKKWDEVFVNFNWKDRPADFNDYYLAYWADPAMPPPIPPAGFEQKFGLDRDKFEINLSVLQEGRWKKELEHPLVPPPIPVPPPPDAALKNPKTGDNNRRLFPEGNLASFCTQDNPYEQSIYIRNDLFSGFVPDFEIDKKTMVKYENDTRNGFLQINLQNQDFLHKDYAFVLARQMMALGKYPDSLLEGAVYRDLGNGTVLVFSNLINIISNLKTKITAAKAASDSSKTSAGQVYDQFNADAIYTPGVPPIPPASVVTPPPPLTDPIDNLERDDLYYMLYNAYAAAINTLNSTTAVEAEYLNLEAIYNILNIFTGKKDEIKPLTIPIPNEPWTPIIKNISIDYKATANAEDLQLVHLYPFDGTNKTEQILLEPTLFPTHCDEGNLFIGLEKLVPGTNLNILFQLAEATADSESDKEDIFWHYLDNNIWKPLRAGFEVLHDGTENLTTSGIIQFALPENMTNMNSVMPKDLHWIKATVPKNSRSVSETTGIYTQAVAATFNNTEANDKLRLNKPIEAGQIAKLDTADASVKQVIQPYETFGGQVPEEQGMFYVRVSELLRHKGRAIQKFDYERIVLDAFPEIFKTKCISHSFGLNAHQYKNDFPYAPGYIIMAVIPDLNKLKAGNAFEPKAPVSILEKIDAYVRKRNSPFVRFRSMNPRYEKIHLCLQVKLVRGKDENYYKHKLKEDIRTFLAPWAIGKEYDKLRFGQCVNRSSLIGYMESLNYIDFILALNMRHETQSFYPLDVNGNVIQQMEICPKTPRSILIAGDIDVCINPESCENWAPDTRCDNKEIKLIKCKPTEG